MLLWPPTLEQCQQIRLWRNKCIEVLRTPYYLTEEMQEIFYRETVCNPNSPHRYYAISLTGEEKEIPDVKYPDMLGGVSKNKYFVGLGGLTNIQWSNSIAEISLIINPEYRKKGYGKEAVSLLLNEAFNRLNLKTAFGECYCINDNADFWKKLNPSYTAYLPNRKFWNGKYWDSLYFSFDRDGYK